MYAVKPRTVEGPNTCTAAGQCPHIVSSFHGLGAPTTSCHTYSQMYRLSAAVTAACALLNVADCRPSVLSYHSSRLAYTCCLCTQCVAVRRVQGAWVPGSDRVQPTLLEFCLHVLPCFAWRMQCLLPVQTPQLTSPQARLLPLFWRASPSSPALLSPNPLVCGSMFVNTCMSSLHTSCPRLWSSSVELIRLLRVSFFKTTDQPGMALSCTKKTCTTKLCGYSGSMLCYNAPNHTNT